MAQALLITTLLTIAGILATSFVGYIAHSPALMGRHILFALPTIVIGLFSQSMTMFFFIGTGKEIKDKARGMPDEQSVVAATKRFKARVFPVAFYSMIVLMITFIVGGGAHTGKMHPLVHHLLALASIALYARAYWVEIRVMDENAVLMERLLKE